MQTSPAPHPEQALFDPDEVAVASLPVCDHYAGVEVRMRKSLQLQAELGPVFDVTLDNEDGAPVGGELDQAQLIAELLASPDNRFGRVGVRLLPVVHPLFEAVLHTVLSGASKGRHAPAYLMCPKPRHVGDVQHAVAAIDAALTATGTGPVPVHALIETHGALCDVWAIAALPRIESLSFGLMDFVSAHRGAIPASAMGAAGQFDHPLVVRAKLEIAAACHACGKVPSHCVVTEFKDTAALRAAVDMASGLLGYTRMWSIHPAQVRTIVEAFAPKAAELDEAVQIIAAAQAAHWAPIRQGDTLHDRASFRYYWQLIQRAERTSFAGVPLLPEAARVAWFTGNGSPNA